ncbi:hypothetical protein QQP08_002624 [Theobroma cacao]|nr:hypothetical protein QQP08_002624 [Theobroma cacao]
MKLTEPCEYRVLATRSGIRQFLERVFLCLRAEGLKRPITRDSEMVFTAAFIQIQTSFLFIFVVGLPKCIAQ